MTLEGLMQKGRKDCSTLEKVADGFLYCPKKLWLGKKVSSRKDEGLPDVTKASSYLNGLRTIDGHLAVITFPLFLGLSVLALPLYGIGLGLKKVAILSSSESKDDHKVCERALKVSCLKEEIDQLKLKRATLLGKRVEVKAQKDLPQFQEGAKKRLKYIKADLKALDSKIEKKQVKLGAI